MTDFQDCLTQSYPAVPGSLPIARRAVARLARAAGANEEQIGEIRLAVSEALTNVILHAYCDEQGQIHVTAVVVGGELWLVVADDGGGLRANSEKAGLGLGLALIAQVSDELTIARRPCGGTEIRIRFRLRRAASDRAARVAARPGSRLRSSPSSPAPLRS